VDIVADDIPRLLKWSKENRIHFVVVGPEAPLAKGIVDKFQQEEIFCFGANKKAARLETSKVFAKELMRSYHIPTAHFESFRDYKKASKYLETIGTPIVVKADGLAAGKGVCVAQTKKEAQIFLDQVMQKRTFSAAGDAVVLVEGLWGDEASFLVVSDGEYVIPLASAQDHKRVFDKDEGPNTGGMGAFSPTPKLTAEIQQEVLTRIIYPMLGALRAEGIIYRGLLYAGLMLTVKGPKVLEFNVRFGDPETQVILPRLQGNFLEMMEAASKGELNKIEVSWDPRAAACVVLASKGYPGHFEKGKVIEGVDKAAKISYISVFHAATEQKDDKLVTAGGRVLGVTALGEDIPTAVGRAYQAASKIKFEGMHYRKDIGKEVL
jgi:phosphoribosylamine--glycine ligase